jgi:hypothetical protein
LRTQFRQQGLAGVDPILAEVSAAMSTAKDLFEQVPAAFTQQQAAIEKATKSSD